MTPIKLKSELEQSAAKLREMRANLASEKTDILSSCDKLQANSRRGKLKPGETAYLGKRVDGLKKQYQDVLAQQDKHIELQNAAIRHELQMMQVCLPTGWQITDWARKQGCCIPAWTIF
jgi:Na+/glutamate symporter